MDYILLIMVEKAEFVEVDNKEKTFVDKTLIKGMLKVESSRNMNRYYRAEGGGAFSLMALILCIFMWDEISDPLYFLSFTMIFNFMMMMMFIFRHFKEKGVFG